MSSVIIVRRYRCWDEQNIKRSLYHEALLQISGATSSELMYVSKKLAPMGYKLSCNCPSCLSYTQELRTDMVIEEPLMKGIALTFNCFIKIGYNLESTSTVQNYDGSSTTTWILIRNPKVSNI